MSKYESKKTDSFWAFNDMDSYKYTDCSHYQDNIRIGHMKVLVSGYNGLLKSNKFKGKNIDLGIYLDPAWAKLFPVLVTPNSYYFDKERRHPGPNLKPKAILVNWPDMGVIDVGALNQLANIAIQGMGKGYLVEIGCIGGHGRTGTFLAAMMMKVEKLSAKRAVDYVRERYCNRAVETKSQEDLLKNLQRRLYGGHA